jgi:hypothetical protein
VLVTKLKEDIAILIGVSVGTLRRTATVPISLLGVSGFFIQ